MKSSEELTIGELAERFGLATRVLRHRESVGLIEPARRAGGQRRYGQDALVRVALILMGKEAGLGLRELSAVLSAPDPMDHRDLLRRHVVELEHRIARARTAKDLIEHALACPHRFADCAHAREQTAARIPAGQTGRAADTY
jgi:DNA-binding transcriptional MerR regulator